MAKKYFVFLVYSVWTKVHNMSRIVIFFVMVFICTSSARPGWSQSKEGEVEEPAAPPSGDVSWDLTTGAAVVQKTERLILG